MLYFHTFIKLVTLKLIQSIRLNHYIILIKILINNYLFLMQQTEQSGKIEIG